MSRTGFLILVGVLTILTPFSGLPIAARSFLTAILGICTLAVGLSLRTHEAHRVEVATPLTVE